jgi:autoinducer 2-degrading protein
MDQQPVYIFAKWQMKEGQSNTVLDLLAEVSKKSKEEEGNLFYQIHQSSSEVNTLMLYEAYKDEAALTDHRNSEHFQQIVIAHIVPLLENREVVVANLLF